MDRKRILYAYYPGKSFPAISVTGSKCKLNCSHCGGKYLKSMISATDAETLLQKSKILWQEGASGILISGGCEKNGRIYLEPFLDSFTKIKEQTGLTINLHTGLIDQNEIPQLARSGVDVVSFDLVGNKKIIKNVYGLDNSPEDYFTSLENLINAGLDTVPHICIGINPDSIGGELYSIQKLRKFKPRRLIFIVFIPTKGTKMENKRPPDVSLVEEVISSASSNLPDTELILGCMRPRKGERYELASVKAGVTGIVLPSPETIERLKGDGWDIRKAEYCCAMP